jgi:lysophospholipase L1-like esterase
VSSSKLFDGVFDFDAMAGDEKNPARIRVDLEAPDHIHSNAKGYAAIAGSVPLSMLDDNLRN